MWPSLPMQAAWSKGRLWSGRRCPNGSTWCAGDIPFASPDAAVAAELREIGPQGFATRRLFSCFMRWFFEHVRSLAPETISIEEIQGEVTRVRASEGHHLL